MTPARRLLHYFGRYKGAFLLGTLCVIGAAVFALLKPLIVGGAVDRIGSAHSSSDLLIYGLQYIGATIAGGLLGYLQRRIIMIDTSWRIDYDLRNDFYAHLQKLPTGYYQEQRTGDLMARATDDISAVRSLVGPAVTYASSSLLMIGGASAMMMRIDRTMAMIAIASIPFLVAVVVFYGRRIHARHKAVRDHFGEVSARVQENLAGARTVRAFRQETNELRTFKRMNREYVARTRSVIRMVTVFHPLLNSLIGLMWVSIFVVGCRKMIARSLSIGEFVAFQFFISKILYPLLSLGWVINLFQRGMASMRRLHEVWSAEPEASPDGGAGTAETIQGEVEIRGLTFAYTRPGQTEARPALRDIHLHVRPGETVGIVGRTGSGKSTLFALISRTFEPPSGTIFIDNRPVEAIPLHRLRDWIGMVPQETFLFSDSIAENIRFGNADASADAVREAANLAGLSDDMAAFPQGLETMIGERGILLSGGQKQRTAIARALVRDPRILLLDDALSAVDTHTEDEILGSLRAIRKDRAVLIVSHRVSSVKDADEIVVLDDGSIVERGTHESLLAQGGYYANLYRMQTLQKQLDEIA